MIHAYIRASTDKQEDSPQAQVKCILGWLEKNPQDGEVEFYTDITSGKTSLASRPHGSLLMSRLGDGDTIVCVRLDRICRSNRDFFGLLEILKEKKCKVVFASEGRVVDPNNPTDELVLSISATVAQYERALISARTREGIMGKSSGRPKFGHTKKNNVETRLEWLTPLEERVKELRATGLSANAISRHPDLQAISGRVVSQPVVRRMLVGFGLV